MVESLNDIYTNIDNGVYKVKDYALKIRDLTVSEMEELQLKQAELEDSIKEDMSKMEILKIGTKYQTYFLKLAFGNDVDIKELKKTLTGWEFKTMMEQVTSFLVEFSGPEGAKEFTTTWTEKINSAKKSKGS